MNNLTPKDIEILNSCENFLSFNRTWIFNRFINCVCKILGLFYGNQGGKTSGVACSYVLRLFGIHPVPKKNVVYWECEHRPKAKIDEEFKKGYLTTHKNLDSATFIYSKLPKDMKCPECGGAIIQHKRNSRIIRFCSETLPGQSANVSKEGLSAEVKNTQYPELKKWLPKFLIKRDITVRNPAMTLFDVFGGADIIIEFVSYNQTVQSTAGPQRMSIWCDEEPPDAFLEEQWPRLLAEDGDMVITCTPANRLSILYDDVFEKAKFYFRTPAISERYKLKEIEKTDSTFNIAVFQAATDDNPTLSKDDIENLFREVDDPDALSIRRYGIFKQVSGRIYKSFEWNVHVISKERYFPNGMPKFWNHFRGIDYHEHVPWACGGMSISPQDEAFIWLEYNPSPENFVTLEIAREFALSGKDYKFTLDLIDPLAQKNQPNTGTTVVEDLNRAFHQYKKEGIGTGAYWQTWDTKSTRGRDKMRERLKNAALVGKPFNNVIVKNGQKLYLPTLWILDTCRMTARSMRNWRLEEWANNDINATKEMKETPQQKWSHFPMVYECLFKNPACRAKPVMAFKDFAEQRSNHNTRRFKGEAYAGV